MSRAPSGRSSRRACRGSSPTASGSAGERRGGEASLSGEASLRGTVRRAILLVGSGVALALAYPRWDWEGLAWVALAPLIVTALGCRPRAALGWTWLAGFAFFLVLLRWLDFTVRTYSVIPWPLTWLPTMTLAGYCGLYVGLFGAAVSWIGHRRSPVWALAAAPFLWVADELVRGRLMGGFPWGSLGYSQYLQLPVIQIAELAGVAGVSFVVLAVNAAVAGCVVLDRRPALGGLAVAAALLLGTLAFGAWRLGERPGAETAAVAIMQPSIEQPLKWERHHTVETLAIYFALSTRAGADHPDLLVWPETASPTLLRRDPELLKALRELSGRFRMPLLVGSIDALDGPPARDTNTAFFLTERGIEGRYDKMHLVPFGEFVPLSRVIGFTRGWAEFISELEPGSRSVVFPGPPAPFGVVICYEGIFPELVGDLVEGGARLIVNMTNDAWFGRTSGPGQHLAMYPFRAVEHRTAVVRSANTGVSAFIAPSGRITQRMGLFARGTKTERVPLRWRTTLYTRFGDWFAWAALALSAAALAAALRARGEPDARRA